MSGICSPGSCHWCGCTFRKPSDVMYHRCAAMQEAADLLRVGVDEAVKSLPEDEQRRYRECQQSVIDARREGERIARELWIG